MNRIIDVKESEKVFYDFDITNQDVIYNVSENSKLVVYQYGINIDNNIIINLNGEKTSSPFVIKAIGSSIYMNSALTRAGGTIENLNRYIQISVKTSNNITIKKYTGVINPKYIKYAE